MKLLGKRVLLRKEESINKIGLIIPNSSPYRDVIVEHFGVDCTDVSIGDKVVIPQNSEVFTFPSGEEYYLVNEEQIILIY